MLRKRFIALVMALTMLFTLMAPAFTFALDDGETPDQTPHSETGEGGGEGEPLRETPTTRSTLTEGWYLIGINGWTEDNLNEDDKFVPIGDGIYKLTKNLDENVEFKAIYVHVDGDGPRLDNNSLFPGDGNNNVKPGPGGLYYIYFHDDPNDKWLRATPLQDEHYYYIGSDIDWEEPRAVELGSDLSITLTFYDATEFKIIECYDHGLLDWYGDSSGNDVSVKAGTYIIRLEGSVATATQVYTLTTAVSPDGSGKLVASKTAAVEDEQITLTVTPAEGYRFDKLVVNNVEYTVTLDANHQTVISMPSADATVTAYFAAIEYVIETDANIAHGSVFASLNEATVGQEVILTVTPEEGYQVSEVKYNDTVINPDNGGYSFTMPALDVTVTATFTVEPALPEARVDILEPVFNVPVYDPNTFQETGKVVEKVEDVYKFTPYEVTSDQASTYANWRCDYRISFNDTLVAESFGLFGAYGDYGRIAFLYPKDVDTNTVVYLLKDFNLDSKLTFTEVLNNVQEFKCGAFNLNEANKGKKMTVELVIWKDGEEELVIATKDYTFGDPTRAYCIVELKSEDTNGNTGIATLIGGGELPYAQETTVTAPALDSYTFLGWFESDTKKSNDSAYTFTVEKEITLVAKYEPTGTGLLTSIGSNYTVDDSEEQNSTSVFDKAVGDNVIVKYTGALDNFVYWVNASGNIISTSPTFNFRLVGKTTIRLVTAVNEETRKSVYVVFKNAYKQVIHQGRYVEDDYIDYLGLENAPTKMGFEFDKWVFEATGEEATAEEILGMASSEKNVIVVVIPQYKDPTDSYTVNVKYRLGNTTVDVASMTGIKVPAGKTRSITVASIKAACPEINADFSYWMLEGIDYPVSFDDKQYTVFAGGGQTVDMIAVFGDTKLPEPTVAITQMVATGNTIISTTMRYFAAGHVVAESGFVFTTKAESGTKEMLCIGGVNAVKHISYMTSNAAIYTFHGNMGTKPGSLNKTLYIRAYLTYIDGNELKTIYSDVFSGSYNGLKTINNN